MGQTLTATNWHLDAQSDLLHLSMESRGDGDRRGNRFRLCSRAADVGNTLTVSVVATNGSGGSSSAATSPATSVRHRHDSDEQLCPNDLWNRPGGPDVDGDNWHLDAQSNLLHLSMESRGDGDRRGNRFHLCSRRGGCRQHADGLRRRHEFRRVEFRRDQSDHSFRHRHHPDKFGAACTISGTAQVGQTLTATTGVWTHNPTSFTYQWNRAGTAIGGATASTYVPVAADVGNTLTVAIVATNSGGSSSAATSPATVSVIDMIPTNSSVPTISGTAQVGQTLTATTGVWTHNPTSFTYQWNRAGTAIGGATASTYVPVAADIGNTLTVSVVATNSGGSSFAATSAATSAVAAAGSVPANTVLPTLSGTPQVGQTLTATNGTWTNSPTSFTYQWNRAGSAISGATASAYVPVSADVGNTLTVSVTATNGFGSSTPATSAATSAVIDIIPTNSSVPTISGTAQVGQTLTATTGVWTHNPTSFTYQWNRAGTAIAGATASTYVPVAADVGNTLTVAIVATNSGGSSFAATSPATVSVIDMIPTNSSVPTISGTAQVGQTLTATTGVWTHNPTSFTYQWNRAGTAIGGATASTYVPVAADVGNTLTVAIVATNSGGSSFAATSPATVSVIDMIPTNSSVPTISGTAQVGQTLTATTGTWTHNPTSFTYQWNRAGTAIGGATASAYVPVAGDIGNTLTVSVTASNSGGTSSPATSVPTAAVIGAGSTFTAGWNPSTTPSVGALLFTGHLNAAGGVSSGGVVLPQAGTIQSISVYCTVPSGDILLGIYDNSGAGGFPGKLLASTASTALVAGWNTINVTTPVSLAAGTYWFLMIVDSNTSQLGNAAGTAGHLWIDGGQPYSMPAVAPSAFNTDTPIISIYGTFSTGLVPVNTAAPVIAGTAQVGQTLTATTGTWTNTPASYAYQWNRAGAAIAGATASTYVPVAADVGNTLTVAIVATNSGGSSSAATSSATVSVIDIIPTNSSAPTISGTAQVGQTLTAATGIWTHNPTSFTYQWNRAGAAIGGATASTYVPVAADVGNTLTVSVVATNSGGSSSAAISPATSSVIDIIPTNSSAPTISGTAQVGQTLTATTGVWTHNPTSFTYQWNRAGTAIGGATASTYVPVAADVGNTLTVSVVATNSGGSSFAATSPATSSVIDIIPTNSAVPAISGTAQVGQTLTATTGVWTHNPTSFTYQWNSAGVNATGPGATTSAYMPVAADIGNMLTVSVVARNSGGSSSSATSTATSAVTAASGGMLNFSQISDSALIAAIAA